jgi:hypothetical protein
MAGKASKTTTGWRRRYLAQVWSRTRTFEVVLVRGSAKWVRRGVHRVLVLTNAGKWEWYEMDDYTYNIGRKFFEASERGEMLAFATRLRMDGFSLMGEVPSW